MANSCMYTMRAVSKKKSALNRLVKIMKYKDKDYFINRCNSVVDDEIVKNDGFYSIDIHGDVAWSCVEWFNTNEDESKHLEGSESITTSHYITLDLLCEKLGIGLELYSQESGYCFQEHYLVHHDGGIEIYDKVKWEERYEDYDGNELDEPESIGGYEDYGEFISNDLIYESNDSGYDDDEVFYLESLMLWNQLGMVS